MDFHEVTVTVTIDGKDRVYMATLGDKTPGQCSRLQKAVQEAVDLIRAEAGAL